MYLKTNSLALPIYSIYYSYNVYIKIIFYNKISRENILLVWMCLWFENTIKVLFFYLLFFFLKKNIRNLKYFLLFLEGLIFIKVCYTCYIRILQYVFYDKFS